MATSSRYIQLSSSVLLEYIYADQSVINTPSNEFRISTSTDPLWKLENGNNGIPHILNADSSGTVVTGSPSGTANVRDKAFAFTKLTEGALLDIDKITPYNDYDPNITNTGSLPITFTAPQAPVYDRIRLHLVQGFNFEQNDGLIFSIKIEKKTTGDLQLLNLVYNKTDNWQTMNASPFFFAGKVYSTYLEARVLSTYNLINDYWLGVLTGDTVVERITDGDGVKKDQGIQTRFAWIKQRREADYQQYITFYDGIEVDLPTRDQFETVSAVIQESTGGDYIEFYAAYNGAIIEDFIVDLNRSGYDFIILHDLVVSEYIYDGIGGYSWVKTDDLQLSQTTDYDQVNVYRPVIRNSSAIAYKIDYVTRLYNRNDNTQIWKASSMISNSPAKYGKRLQKINLGSNPIQTKIYNQQIVKDIQIRRGSDPVISNTKFVTSFINSNSISVSYQNVNPSGTTSGSDNQGTTQTGSNLRIYDNGLARIAIPEGDAYLKFNLYQRSSTGANETLNATGLGEFKLAFINDNGEEIRVSEIPSDFANKGAGEIVFRVGKTLSKDILKFNNNAFNIYLINEQNDDSLLYSGRFFSVDEFQKLAEIDKVTQTEQTLSTITDALNVANNKIASQVQTIQRLTEENLALISDDFDDDAKIQQLRDTINNLNRELISQQNDSAQLVLQLQNDLGIAQSENDAATLELLQAQLDLINAQNNSVNFQGTLSRGKLKIKDNKGSNFS
jgi:hypothetical protein